MKVLPKQEQSMLVCQGSLFFLKFLVKKGHNSKNIAFRVMSLVLQLHLVKMSKFGVDTFNTFWVMGYTKLFAWWQQWSNDLNFEQNMQDKFINHIPNTLLDKVFFLDWTQKLRLRPPNRLHKIILLSVILLMRILMLKS